jgi:hypothetical protein
MGRYRSICDFGVFVKVDEAVSEKMKTLDFDELTKLHSSLRHLESRCSNDKVIEYSTHWNATQKWRLYDSRTEPAEESSDSDERARSFCDEYKFY